MAPELLTHRSSNTKETDVYAFGILLYETVSRRDPYWEDEDKDLMQILSQIADPAIHKRPPVPADCAPQLGSLMHDCLVVNPKDRPSFEELDQRLQRINVNTVESNNTNLRRKSRNLEQDGRSTISLFDIFPSHIAEALRDGQQVQAEHHDNVTIFFSDIVGKFYLCLFLE
jgi:guanylate cyclase, other